MQDSIDENTEVIRWQYQSRRDAVAADCFIDIQRSGEVDSFRFHHGMPLEEALNLVGLDRANYRECKTTPIWLPTPEHIELEMKRIRSGEALIEGTTNER